MIRSVFVFACLAVGCSASGDPSQLSLGRDGAGGATSGPPAASAGAGGGLVITGDAGASRVLTARIEDTSGLAIELVTLSCSDECADVLAVARGGFAPYSYRWEDGSTTPARHVCPNATTTFVVSATDSGDQSPEFTVAPQTAQAHVTAQVIQCPDAGPPPPPPPDAAPPSTGCVRWVDWSTINVGTTGNATGVVSLPSGNVEVDYSGEVNAAYVPQGGTNNFVPPTTYTSATVPVAPSSGGMIAVTGVNNDTHKIQFAEPVTDPLIAVWSIGFGSLGMSSTWEFDVPPTILSSGVNGYGLPGSTLTVSDRRVTGVEGSGVLEFKGTYSVLSFTIPVPEGIAGYGGFTVGVRCP